MKSRIIGNYYLQNITLNGYEPRNYIELINKTYQNNQLISFTINKNTNEIIVCCSHSICDGVGIIEKYFNNLFTYENNKLPKLPVIKTNYFILLYSLFYYLLNIYRLRIIIPKVLHNNSNSSTIYTFTLNVSEIKLLSNQHKCSFNAAVQVYILNCIRDYSNYYKILTAIPGDNDNCFNSVGYIPYNINFNNLNNYLGKTIDNKLKENRFIGIISLNKFLKPITYFVNKEYSTLPDILFSGLSIGSNNVYLYKTKLRTILSYTPNHTLSMYVNTIKTFNKLTFSIGVRDQGLNNFLKKYNWEIIN